MGTVSPAQIADGTTMDASDVNNPINTIANEFNGNIDNSNIKSAAAIDASKVAGGVTGMFGAWTSWTPTWTNLTIGNGTNNAKYAQIGKSVLFRISVTFGSTTAMGSIPNFSLPVTSIDYVDTNILATLASGRMLDSSASTIFNCGAFWLSTTTARIQVYTATGGAGTGIGQTDLTSTTPWTWAVSDKIYLEGFYEAA